MNGADLDGDGLFAVMRSVFVERHGERAGTLKFPGVTTELSALRQQAGDELSDRRRAVLAEAVEKVTVWMIERDPEAAERVASGGRALAPQDIGTAARVAHDFGLAQLSNSLSDADRAVLEQRWRVSTVETVQERIKAGQPKLTLSNRSVQGMVFGFALMFGGFVLGAATGVYFGVIFGLVILVMSIRKLRSGAAQKNVGPNTVNTGGGFGKARRSGTGG